MDSTQHWSRLPGFFDATLSRRREILLALPIELDSKDLDAADMGLKLCDADRMSENVIATFSLPLSVAANFVIDDEPVLVPMVTEEPSIVAACSKMAKIVSLSGGFYTTIDRSLIKGQIQLYRLRDSDRALDIFAQEKKQLLEFANSLCPKMVARGGGVVDISAKLLPSKVGPMLVIEPMIDVVDAMGANFVNTIVEKLAQKVAPIFDGAIGLKILSNLCDRRLATARCQIPFAHLCLQSKHEQGFDVAQKIMAAHAFAETDIYRACTHNKGILNGIDAVAIATGNDFRAIEAGAHAYAAMKQGGYGPLSSIRIDHNAMVLHATLTLPLAVGVVGGISGMHSGVVLAQKILGNFSKTSKRLAAVMVSVGLSQYLAALLALTQEGIQKGHMKLHEKKYRAAS